MKATISKSNVMKRAWMIYHQSRTGFIGCRPTTFGLALRRAWKEEKREVEMKSRKPNVTKRVDNMGSAYHAGCLAWYQNAPAGTYFGD